MKNRLKTAPPAAQKSDRDPHVLDASCEIPAVCLLDDLARILRTSRRTIQRLRRHRAFPIPELPSLDKRPRWSGQAVAAFLHTAEPTRRAWRRTG